MMLTEQEQREWARDLVNSWIRQGMSRDEALATYLELEEWARQHPENDA